MTIMSIILYSQKHVHTLFLRFSCCNLKKKWAHSNWRETFQIMSRLQCMSESSFRLTSKNSQEVFACPVSRLRSFTLLYVTIRLFHLRRIFSTGSTWPFEAISSWTLWKSCERSRVSYRPQRRPTASIRHKTALEEKSEPEGSIFSEGAGDITDAGEERN